MSLLKVNSLQIGQSATPANNFGLAVPAVPDGSVRLQRGNVGGAIEDLLTIAASGIVSAGYNPATGNRSTALATMQKFTDEFPASFLQNGWTKMPNGLLLQWGTTVSIPAGSNANVFFPVAFSVGTLQALVTAQQSANGNTPVCGGWQSGDVNSFTLRNLSTIASQFTWLMIGR